MTMDGLFQAEEAKRDRAWDPAERWNALMDTIAWAEAQLPEPRNAPACCLRLERDKLRRLAPDPASRPGPNAS